MANNNHQSEPNETHLGFLQDNITRMSQNSFQAKAWDISIISALLAFMLSQDDCTLKLACIWISLLVTILFCLLDVYYLYLERGYRELYNIAAGLISGQTVPKYDMKIPQNERGVKKYMSAFLSLSTGAFYGAVLFGLIIMNILIWKGIL